MIFPGWPTWALSPKRTLRLVITAAVFGVLATIGWSLLTTYVRPPIPEMQKWTIEKTTDGHSWLIMTYRSAALSSCSRVGAYLLSRPGATDRLPDYIPMGNSLVGPNLNSKPGLFRVWLDVSGVPSGEWEFVYRTLHFCGPLGLIEWPDPGKQIGIAIP